MHRWFIIKSFVLSHFVVSVQAIYYCMIIVWTYFLCHQMRNNLLCIQVWLLLQNVLIRLCMISIPNCFALFIWCTSCFHCTALYCTDHVFLPGDQIIFYSCYFRSNLIQFERFSCNVLDCVWLGICAFLSCHMYCIWQKTITITFQSIPIDPEHYTNTFSCVLDYYYT